ncbi:maleylacetoacetate isomerase [Phenylobacterium sp. LH3H17]|uniref:maleylacetoacetate isomerase n=1 Tax=Phenylobacterium sp. LH3H17 TaxID=2903901 RepID=UPI0020C94EA9|nr:maleylacetoacetate isomerase [Phenylobacterium sp. LH3H17]UTP39434.1 maleylacetoacetate isomerase [Phenylobacterium sp. LH3H17]
MSLTLHSYWRATAPYRVRIGLQLKGLDYGYVAVNLLEGNQHQAAYRAVNPQRLTPALDIGDGEILTQSLAILEWLDETHPEPALLPKTALDRARVRAMADIVACDIHPLNNMRVNRALEAMEVSAPRRAKWVERWIVDGFQTLEPMVAKYGQGFAFGDTPTLADCCLIPQVYSAQRYKVDLEAFPAIRAVAEHAAQHHAFIAAHPDNQPDAKPV